MPAIGYTFAATANACGLLDDAGNAHSVTVSSIMTTNNLTVLGLDHGI
jgi:hypothetical protein